MAYRIAQGIQVSVDNGSTWYKLSDHNRQPIGFSYEIIENSQRMANGSMRKYVVAKKIKVSVSWNDLPSLNQHVVDYSSAGKGAAWMKAFYEANVFNPVLVKVIFAEETVPSKNSIPVDSTYVDALRNSGHSKAFFITNFTYDVQKRTMPTAYTAGIDYANIKIDFTEI